MFLQSPFIIGNSMGTFPLDGQGLLLILVKLLLVLGAVIYLIFSFVVVRQIQIMRSTLVTPFSSYIRLAGLVHMFFAMGVVAYFIIGL